jgi:hypothetical protein
MATRAELIEEARRVAQKLGKKTITRAEFVRETNFSANQIYVHCDGGWRELSSKAGLEPNLQNVRLGDAELYSAMRDAFVELGGITTRAKFNRAFCHSVDVFKKRGLKWKEALVELRRWCERNDPEFAYLGDLPAEVAATPRPSKPAAPSEIHARVPERRLYGEVLSFRGLLHAPTNELGVVFLFGVISQELGFVVESVQAGYPDCEAKRRVGPGRWQRVRIEFEFRSRSFRDHGHDPEGCDLLVCWEHNYPDCPVEVLSLKEVIRQLPAG